MEVRKGLIRDTEVGYNIQHGMYRSVEHYYQIRPFEPLAYSEALMRFRNHFCGGFHWDGLKYVDGNGTIKIL